MFDTGISIPAGAPTVGIPGCTATALSRSLDVIEPYNPVPFKPYKRRI